MTDRKPYVAGPLSPARFYRESVRLLVWAYEIAEYLEKKLLEKGN